MEEFFFLAPLIFGLQQQVIRTSLSRSTSSTPPGSCNCSARSTARSTFICYITAGTTHLFFHFTCLPLYRCSHMKSRRTDVRTHRKSVRTIFSFCEKLWPKQNYAQIVCHFMEARVQNSVSGSYMSAIFEPVVLKQAEIWISLPHIFFQGRLG